MEPLSWPDILYSLPPITPLLASDSPIPEELESLIYPPTKDEQIVNTALLIFLNALTAHFPLANDWTLHRKIFVAQFKHASIEARTDGYLGDRSDGKVRALVEVKPAARKKYRTPIRMQESAQMVAWIMNDPEISSPGR